MVLIFTPVFWDVDSFKKLRDLSLQALSSQEQRIQFIVIDDSAGTDPSISTLQSFSDVRVVTPPFNLGHQRAIVFGLRSMAQVIQQNDLIVTMDSDGEDQPTDVPRLLNALQSAPNGSIVLAYRTKRRESLPFKLLYFFFKIAFRLLTGRVIRTGNFAAYSGQTAQRNMFHPNMDLCYSSTLLTLGAPVVNVACERGARLAGKSHMNYSRLIIHGLSMLMPFIDRIAVRFLVTFSVIFGMGLVMAGLVVGVRTMTTLAIPGWATYSLLLTLLAALNTLGFSVLLFMIYSQLKFIFVSNIDRHASAGTTPSSSN